MNVVDVPNSDPSDEIDHTVIQTPEDREILEKEILKDNTDDEYPPKDAATQFINDTRPYWRRVFG